VAQLVHPFARLYGQQTTVADQRQASQNMSTLKNRIASVGTIPPSLSPYDKDYGDIKSIPLVRIQIQPDIVMYDEMRPLIAPDGGIIPATSPGTWGQLYAVGKQRRY
jgi:hypothetical protein